MRKAKGHIIILLMLALCPYLDFAQIKPPENNTLYEALLYLGNRCNLKMAYDADYVKTVKIKVDYKNLDCDEALSELLTGTSLNFVKTV